MTDAERRQALEMFQEATRLDPRFARAYASMGVCYIELWTKSVISWDEFVKGAKQAAARALELDENLADTHALLSWISWVVDDHVNDEIEAKKAVELNPNLAAAYNMLAAIKATNGYPKEAISLSETAHQLDPLSPRCIMLLGSMYLYRGREREALELWKRNLRFAPLDSLAGIATYHLCRGEYKEAEDVCSQLERDFPNEAAIQAFRGYLQALQGDSSGAQETMRKLREVFGVGAPVEQHIANIKYFLGDLDGYFASMFRVVETHVLDPVDIRYSPLFEGARRDPRYREVMVKNGLDPDLKE